MRPDFIAPTAGTPVGAVAARVSALNARYRPPGAPAAPRAARSTRTLGNQHEEFG